jgi:hypothetical protein
MTRGPPPLKAIGKGKKIAALQGEVMNNTVLARARYGFVVFRNNRTVFVRIKRVRAHVSDPAEILLLFRLDVLQLRSLPKTPVTSREIWTLSPWNTWQFFVIENDRIAEVRYEVPPELPPAETAGAGAVAPAPGPGVPPVSAPLPGEPAVPAPTGGPLVPTRSNVGGDIPSVGGQSDDEVQGGKPA